jgi:hypothetical protein
MWTKEHILPKSKFPIRDQENIIPLPRRINNQRQTKKYTEGTDGYVVATCQGCQKIGWCTGHAIIGKDFCNPPQVFKPLIGKTVLRMANKYPEYKNQIFEEVLDRDLAIKWAHMKV